MKALDFHLNREGSRVSWQPARWMGSVVVAALAAGTIAGVCASAYAVGTGTTSSASQAQAIVTGVKLGEIGPGGGIVFYDAGSQQSWGRYLEVAPATWSGAGAPDLSGVWCVAKLDVATGTAIGAGRANTQAIVNTCGATTAAGFAAGYQGGGQRDWYLPSKDELNALYQQRAVVGGPTSGVYWSSSQVDLDPGQAWGQRFDAGGHFSNQGKNIISKVRPIRAIADDGAPTIAPTAPATSVSPSAVPTAAVPTAQVTSPPTGPCVPGGPCGVGRIGPGKGIVFYDAGSEQPWGRYLEVAPTRWANKAGFFKAVWCVERLDVATGTGIGSGADNTDLIIDACGSKTAAGFAARYRGGGKRDWYLPSKDELDALVSSRAFTMRGTYWSSSQVDAFAGLAFARPGVVGGAFQQLQKNALYGVMPIRAF